MDCVLVVLVLFGYWIRDTRCALLLTDRLRLYCIF
jgi:hypothetical protein